VTHGDNQRTKCPACKRPIDRPIGPNEPQRGGIVEGDVECPHCRAKLHFWARWTIAVELELDSKVK